MNADMSDLETRKKFVADVDAMLAETDPKKRRTMRNQLIKQMATFPEANITINGNPKRSYEDTITEYAKRGLTVTAPKGHETDYETMVAVEYDGVQYTLDDNNTGDFDHGIEHLKLIQARHHALVKQVYQYCVGLNVGDIWVLSGGGCQLQAFFGNKDGYMAILYLDMDNSPLGRGYVTGMIGHQKFILQVQRNRNDPLFANLDIKGIKVRTCREVYGEGY